MASTTVTTTLGTSNLRGTSRQTRNNPTRTSRNNRTTLRQNSLIPNPPASAQGAPEPHGFYPAISHFTDAISALPRDYRRHISLLKEVDAKAWLPEESLQNFLGQCLTERRLRTVSSTLQTIAGSSSNAAEDATILSATDSVNDAPFDTLSQYSSQSNNPSLTQRRQLYQSLRLNLMQMMITMDEKNHVINNANEDLSRHIRRLDDIWPHVADEISDEARLGSLKHWAFTDLNPPKKVVAASSRREAAAASLATLVDNDIAHRSESRREAMLAKKQRLNQQVDSDFDDKAMGRKGMTGKGKKPDAVTEAALVSTAVAGKRKKPEKTGGGVAMERTASGLRAGAIAMSREPSQQDNPKKRKAPTTAGVVARKRLNVNQQESPKLTSSPLANLTGKDAVKRSPALSSVRPVARGRQNSSHGTETTKNRPSSSASYRNTTGLGLGLGLGLSHADPTEIKNVAAATGKSASEVKHTMKESTNSRGDRLVEDSHAVNGDSAMRGGILLERTSSNRGRGRKEHQADETRAAPSPRSIPVSLVNESRSGAGGRASKPNTPAVGTFAEADADDSGSGNGGENGIAASMASKLKRAPRPRIKDHHGLHDSLSPKGLPVKRTHTKNLSLSSFGTVQANSNNNGNSSNNRSASSRARHADRDDEIHVRTNTRNNTSTSQSTVGNNKSIGDDDVEDDDIANEEEDELRYCYCNGVSYGEMVACDNKNCPREWFHLECIGLKSLPKSAKWYCDECKENLARKGRFGSNGNGNGNGDK